MAIKLIKDLGFAINHQTQTSAFHNCTVRPTFFFDNASVKAKASAEVWASHHLPSIPRVQAQVRPNTPMDNLWLDNLETRMEGGRAYKVINKDDMTYFDVREDQMLQAILKHGIQAGGKIGGEWIFAMNGSQCKCFLVDSKEYQEVLAREAIKPKVMVKVSAKDLKVGEIYSNKNMTEEYVYMGFIHQLSHYWETPRKRLSKNIHTYLYHNKKCNEYRCVTPSSVYKTGRSMSVKDLVDLVETTHIYFYDPNVKNTFLAENK